MTSLLNECLDNKIKVNIVFVEGKWCEVDSHQDALLYEKEINQMRIGYMTGDNSLYNYVSNEVPGEKITIPTQNLRGKVFS